MLLEIKNSWPEYLIEAWCLGTFMVSACFFGVFFFHPASPFFELSFPIRNTAMGLAMGATAVLIIRSGWGRRSGAHFNPAVTLTFLRLGRIEGTNAFFYVLFQFFGGIVGVLLSWAVLGNALEVSAVNFVVTVPGVYGTTAAFAAEALLSFILMTVVLFTGNNSKVEHLTPYFVGGMVTLFIAVEAPISGMSINPARSFSTSVVSGNWDGWWIYFIAPPAAMLAASEFFLRVQELKRAARSRAEGIEVSVSNTGSKSSARLASATCTSASEVGA